MNWFKKCPTFLLLAVSGLIVTGIGMAGENTIYSGYSYDAGKEPALVLVMKGAGDRVWPWSPEESTRAVGGFVHNGPRREKVSVDTVSGPEPEAGPAGVSENTVSGPDAPPAEERAAYGFETVSEDYFDDAVFIGDSRTVGLFEYAGLENRADFFAKTSLTIYDVLTEPIVAVDDERKKITVGEALSERSYGKIYLMLGINEMGTGTIESFMDAYRQTVERIRELQPDAILFLQGIMRVSADKSAQDPIFNNPGINARNAEIAKLADQRDIFYIDVNETVCDENGDLNAQYTTDSIHLKAMYYSLWKQFLLEHGIVKE